MSVTATASGLASVLPAPAHGSYEEEEPSVQRTSVSRVPPYGARRGYEPTSLQDFGGGGAFPEIHRFQFPLNMGKTGAEAKRQGTASVIIDQETGTVNYDASIYQRGGGSAGKSKDLVVHSGIMAIVPKLSHFDHIKPMPDDEDVEEATKRTKAALGQLMESKSAASAPAARGVQKEPTFVRYTPSQDGVPLASGPKTRVIRMMEMPVDPFEPPKFKHKRAPAAPQEEPVPVMHSPPRKLTAKDQQDWSIPPCVSNWKNHKGFTIPLDKRLAADGRGLEEPTINDNFARLSEALYLAEQKSRQEVELRAQIQSRISAKEKEKREEELRMLAQRAREERAGIRPAQREDEDEDIDEEVVEEDKRRPRASDYMDSPDKRTTDRKDSPDRRASDRKDTPDHEHVERNKLRAERRRERQRDLRMEAAGKKEAEERGIAPSGVKRSKAMRDLDRDVSERVALGEAVASKTGEMLYDQRLFNQTAGLSAGFGDDDAYNTYDKPLFAERDTSQLYQARPQQEEQYGNDEDYEKLVESSKRFKADREFKGAADAVEGEHVGDRSAPVQFEKEDDGEERVHHPVKKHKKEEDPYGIDEFLKQTRSR